MIPFVGKKKAETLEYRRLLEKEYEILDDAILSETIDNNNCQEFSSQEEVKCAKFTDYDSINNEPNENRNTVNFAPIEQSKSEHKSKVLREIFAVRKGKRKDETRKDWKLFCKISSMDVSGDSLNFEWQHCRRRKVRRSAVHDIENFVIRHCEHHIMVSTLNENIRLAGLV